MVDLMAPPPPLAERLPALYPSNPQQPLIEAYLPISIGWEGEERTLYRDSLGFMSVGDGLMLPNLAPALALPFWTGARRSPPAEISAEWARVQAMPKDLRAEAYAIPGCPSLLVAEIADLLRSIVAARVADLIRLLPHFTRLSFAWRLALLDMGYNLSVPRLLKEFPHLILGVEAGSSPECMAECNRPQLSAARNYWTKTQFAGASGLAA